jgi:hypothetical protein
VEWVQWLQRGHVCNEEGPIKNTSSLLLMLLLWGLVYSFNEDSVAVDNLCFRSSVFASSFRLQQRVDAEINQVRSSIKATFYGSL